MEPRLKGTAFCGETCEYIKSTETPFISHWLISVILIRTPKLVQILPKSKKKQEQLWFKIRPTWLPFTFLSGLTLFYHLLNGLCFVIVTVLFVDRKEVLFVLQWNQLRLCVGSRRHFPTCQVRRRPTDAAIHWQHRRAVPLVRRFQGYTPIEVRSVHLR